MLFGLRQSALVYPEVIAASQQKNQRESATIRENNCLSFVEPFQDRGYNIHELSATNLTTMVATTTEMIIIEHQNVQRIIFKHKGR